MKKVVRGISFAPEMIPALKNRAERQGRNISAHIRWLIRRDLEEEEIHDSLNRQRHHKRIRQHAKS
jgi:hypothetical protein